MKNKILLVSVLLLLVSCRNRFDFTPEQMKERIEECKDAGLKSTLVTDDDTNYQWVICKGYGDDL